MGLICILSSLLNDIYKCCLSVNVIYINKYHFPPYITAWPADLSRTAFYWNVTKINIFTTWLFIGRIPIIFGKCSAQ